MPAPDGGGRAGRASAAGVGFTLVEVVLAVAIASIGLTALLAAATKCLAVVRVAKNYENARHMLDWVEVEHPVDKESIESGGGEGVCVGPPDGYTWERAIERVGEAVDEDEEQLHRVRTRVSWSDRGSNAFEEVTTYVFVPKKEK